MTRRDFIEKTTVTAGGMTFAGEDDARKVIHQVFEARKRGFVLEVLSLYIPNLVETPQLKKIAQHLFELDPDIPFTLLAFFPEYQMKKYKSPKVSEMIEAYCAVKAVGLRNVKLGNTGIFASTKEDHHLLKERLVTQVLDGHGLARLKDFTNDAFSIVTGKGMNFFSNSSSKRCSFYPFASNIYRDIGTYISIYTRILTHMQ
jgi:hypothetical protein